MNNWNIHHNDLLLTKLYFYFIQRSLAEAIRLEKEWEKNKPAEEEDDDEEEEE